MQKFDINNTVSIVIPVALVVVIRTLAAYYRWDLPRVGGNSNAHDRKNK